MRISTLAPTAWFSLALSPALLALAPPDISVVNVKPSVNGTLVYLPLAAPYLGAPDAAQLTIDLYLKSLEPVPQLVQFVTIDFPGSPVPGFVRADGLELRCPSSASEALEAPILPYNQTCRLSLMPDMKLPNPAPAQVSINVYAWGNPIPLTIERPMAAYVNTVPNGSYRFPAKATDLPAGYFWAGVSSGAGSHHRNSSPESNLLAYDLGVVRWDDDEDKWVDYEAPDVGEFNVRNTNSDILAWNMPVYAMADGEVQSCDDGNPDNPLGASDDEKGSPNFVKIKHGTDVIWYGHLKNGSIDPAVCFNGALVAEGQFLGRVGNSGDSPDPHLHVHVERNGGGLPLLFNDIFLVARTAFPNPPGGNPPWSGVNKAGLLWEKSAIWPSGLRRHDDAVGVEMRDLVLASASSSQKVSVGRDHTNDLRVDLWNMESDLDLAHVDFDEGGGVASTAGSLAAAQPTDTNDVAAVLRTAAGNLKLIAYDVAGNTLARAAERTETGVLAVSAAPAPFHKGIVTAIRGQNGNLKVIAYEVDAAAGAINRRGEEEGGAVKAVTVAATSAFPGVVTAVRGSDDRLRLQTFSVELDGWAVSAASQWQLATTVKNVSIAWLGVRPDGKDLVVTAAERMDGTLHVAAFAIAPSGAITLLDTETGGTAAAPSIGRASARHAITALTDASGNLKLIAWNVNDAGALVRRTEASGGEATKVSIVGAAPFYPGGPSFTATALRDSAGGLRLIDWQVLLTD